MDDVILLKKLSAKELFQIARDKTEQEVKAYFKELAEKPEGRNFGTIIGDALGYGSKSTKFGPAYFLVGTFVGRNNLTGKKFKASKLYLPKSDAETACATLDKSAGASVGVAYNISVIPDISSGYSYVCTPIGTPEVVDREAQMMKMLDSVPMKALPAPKKPA